VQSFLDKAHPAQAHRVYREFECRFPDGRPFRQFSISDFFNSIGSIRTFAAICTDVFSADKMPICCGRANGYFGACTPTLVVCELATNLRQQAVRKDRPDISLMLDSHIWSA